jgi:hypothetical protein
MKYADFDNAEGKHGGPFLNELQVLEREKLNSGKDGREPQYQLVLAELYSGNLPTQWEQQPEIKDENGTVLNPEAAVWEPLDLDKVVYDVANSPDKQRERELATQDRMLEKYGEDAVKSPFGNVGNQELDTTSRPELADKEHVADPELPATTPPSNPDRSVFDDEDEDGNGKPGAKKTAAKKAVASK